MFASLNKSTKVGIYLIGIGLFFMIAGSVLFFDRGLLAIGNIGLFTGSIILVGNKSTLRWMLQMSKLPATFLFVTGMLLAIFGWGFTGLCIEAVGFYLLFSGLFKWI